MICSIQNFHRIFIILFSIFLFSCANPINARTYSNYYKAGFKAEQEKDFERAQKMYGRALVNAEIGHLGPLYTSSIKYDLGRIAGYLCNYEEAEKLLLEALKLELENNGKLRHICMRYFELARLNFDQGRYEQAIKFFEQGIPIAKMLDIETNEPLEWAIQLTDYSQALSQVSRINEAKTVRADVDLIRSNNPEKITSKYVRYNQNCN